MKRRTLPSAVWLMLPLAHCDHEHWGSASNLAFALCDLGPGKPGFGYVRPPWARPRTSAHRHLTRVGDPSLSVCSVLQRKGPASRALRYTEMLSD
jgi:hypothetical protein